MDSTTPSANFHPQMVQYTPADSTIVKNVLALVSPNRSSLAFVRRKIRANLNLTSNAPRAPSPAAPLPSRDGCGVARGCRGPSMARLSSRARADATGCGVESRDKSSSASRQAASAALESPAWVACSAAAARRLSSSVCTRRWHDGHASRAGATSVPHWGHGDPARPRKPSVTEEPSAGYGSRSLIGSRHPQRHAAVQLPGLVQREPRNEQMQRARETDYDRRGVREPEEDDHAEQQGQGAGALVAGGRGGADGSRGRGGRGRHTGGIRPRLYFLPQLARDQRRVRRHYRAVREEHRQQLVAPATTAPRALADGRADEQPHYHRDEAELVARQRFDAEVHAGPERRGRGARAQRLGETLRGRAAIPRRHELAATTEAGDPAVDLVIRSGNRLVAERARPSRSAGGALGAIGLQALVGGSSSGRVGHGVPPRNGTGLGRGAGAPIFGRRAL